LTKPELTVALYGGLHISVYIYKILKTEFNTFVHVFINVKKMYGNTKTQENGQANLFVRECPTTIMSSDIKYGHEPKRGLTQKINT
jgi:hypothetical protein